MSVPLWLLLASSLSLGFSQPAPLLETHEAAPQWRPQLDIVAWHGLRGAMLLTRVVAADRAALAAQMRLLPSHYSDRSTAPTSGKSVYARLGSVYIWH